MSRRWVVVGLTLSLLAGGCGCHYPRWLPHPFGAPESAPAAPVPVTVTPPEPAKPPTLAPKPAEAPRRTEPKPPAPAAVASVEPAPNDRAKKIASARGDLQTGMTALSLRAVNVCTTPGPACLENRGLMKRAQDLDEQLAAALLDPALPVDWAAVTTVLRAVVDSAMKTVPK